MNTILEPQRRAKHITIRPLERYGDPRKYQIDIDAPIVEMANLLPPLKNGELECERVMPLLNQEKFVRLLRRKTKLFAAIDDSHFWVSSYYALYFSGRSPLNRTRIRALVKQCLEESGGFMKPEEWIAVKEHRKGGRVMIASGTGSHMQLFTTANPTYL